MLGTFGLVLIATAFRVVQIIYEVLFKKCEREQSDSGCMVVVNHFGKPVR